MIAVPIVLTSESIIGMIMIMSIQFKNILGGGRKLVVALHLPTTRCYRNDAIVHGSDGGRFECWYTNRSPPGTILNRIERSYGQPNPNVTT